MTAALSVVPTEFDIDGELPEAGTTTLLEASAGTGKTWAIAALVARYVIEEGLPLERLLVVTFGRAASQELRSRVRERLVDAERHLSAGVAGAPGKGTDALLARLLRGTPDELRLRRDRARQAVTDFDAATIATIHQFCQLVLRGLGVAGDTEAGAELVEDLEELREQVVDDLYVAMFADWDGAPPLTRAAAGALARVVVEDPSARLTPEDRGTDDPADVRVRFACGVREAMELRKRRLGILSYDDLLSRLADALEHGDRAACQRMRARWDVVLVDEFQDTDPVQWRVFDRAFTGSAAMVLIGDPKQAIYAFRGGDVATYTSARSTAHRHATLGVNHRSDAPLVDAVTTLLRGARLGDEIVVRDVRSALGEGRLQGAPSIAPLRLRMVNRLQLGDRDKPPAVGEARAAVAEDLARDVAALLASPAEYDGRPLDAADVAVLCSTGPQCELVRSALVEAGVPAVVLGAASVFASPAADDWLTLLEGLEQPHRTGRVRAVALTAFLGLTAGKLAERGEPFTAELAETLRDWAVLLRERGVAAVLEVAAARHGMGSRLVRDRGGERLLTDVRHLGEVLHDVASRERLGLPALLAWLRTQMAEVRRDAPDDRARRLDSDARAVQVLTIHKAKGLQYPVVYLPFAADHMLKNEDYPRFHDDDGRRCLDVGGSASKDSLERAEAELADERLRLLYVALTRAQSQVVTWWFATGKNLTASSLHRMVMGRVPGQAEVGITVPTMKDANAKDHAEKWEGVGALTVELVRPRTASAPERPEETPALRVRPWTRHVDQVWRRTSYTALSSAAAAEPVAAFGSEPEVTPKEDEPDVAVADAATADPTLAVPSPMAGLPMGATFGSLVHAVLEHTDPAAPGHGGDLRAELVEQIRTQLVRWPVQLDVGELADALVAVCDTPLGAGDGDVTLRQVGRADRMAELDFELPLAGGDLADHPRSRARLADLAPLLREHLPDGDPLRAYADVLTDPGYDAQLLHGYLNGSVDVVLRLNGSRFVVVDYKTNWLAPYDSESLTAAHYAPARLAEAMRGSSYPLQALLYAVVLHRFLRWRLAGYDPERHFGGVRYLYLRGMCGPDTPVVDGERCGIFTWRPPVALVEAVSQLLDGLEADHG
ncbi:MAG TPA: UvrD-helicase domain-containing protein [Marmoricola sp.]|nr:UvrD-helicase domain-containing protein [Marmoricola sp.]